MTSKTSMSNQGRRNTWCGHANPNIYIYKWNILTKAETHKSKWKKKNDLKSTEFKLSVFSTIGVSLPPSSLPPFSTAQFFPSSAAFLHYLFNYFLLCFFPILFVPTAMLCVHANHVFLFKASSPFFFLFLFNGNK